MCEASPQRTGLLPEATLYCTSCLAAVNALNDTEWFFCDIIEVYKYRGVIPEGKVEIIFPSDAVSQGDEYILMLTYPDNEWPDDQPAPFYIMSSKNSIYRPDDPAVEDILREAEQAE